MAFAFKEWLWMQEDILAKQKRRLRMKIKIGLVPRLIIAIILGILVGQFFPLWFCRGIVTLSGVFSSFLKFVIPLMILAYVTMGIADLSH